jgi:hypothetical protein
VSVGNTTPLVNRKRVTKPPTKELVVERNPAFLAVTNSLNQFNFVNESSKSSTKLGVIIITFAKLETAGVATTTDTPCVVFKAELALGDIKFALSAKFIKAVETGKQYLVVRTAIGRIGAVLVA